MTIIGCWKPKSARCSRLENMSALRQLRWNLPAEGSDLGWTWEQTKPVDELMARRSRAHLAAYKARRAGPPIEFAA